MRIRLSISVLKTAVLAVRIRLFRLRSVPYKFQCFSVGYDRRIIRVVLEIRVINVPFRGPFQKGAVRSGGPKTGP